MDSSSEIKDLLRLKSPKSRENLLAYMFLNYRDRLKAMVRLRLDRRLQGRIDPSDVVQEAYLEASERLEGFLSKPEVPVFIWLRFLTGQKLVDLHRHHLGIKRRDARREIRIGQSGAPEATSELLAARLFNPQATPSEAAMKAESVQQIREALEGLKPGDREMIALRHFEGLTSAESARVLGIEERAASKRYVRALERLRAALPGGRG